MIHWWLVLRGLSHEESRDNQFPGRDANRPSPEHSLEASPLEPILPEIFVIAIDQSSPSSITYQIFKMFGIFALLGCYAASIGSYRRFGTTFRSHLQRSSSPRRGLLNKILNWFVAADLHARPNCKVCKFRYPNTRLSHLRRCLHWSMYNFEIQNQFSP